jgi:hypothetical protein
VASKSLAFIASPPPPGQDRPGSFHQAPASRPERGIASVMGTNHRDDRVGAHLLLR